MLDAELQALAANLRRDLDDLSLYAGFLLNTMSAVLPPEMVLVERKSGLFGRVRADAPVLGVTLCFPDRRFVLRRNAVGQQPAARISHESGGIVLTTETVPITAWTERLAQALADYAGHHATAADALRRLTVPGQS